MIRHIWRKTELFILLRANPLGLEWTESCEEEKRDKPPNFPPSCENHLILSKYASRGEQLVFRFFSIFLGLNTVTHFYTVTNMKALSKVNKFLITLLKNLFN